MKKVVLPVIVLLLGAMPAMAGTADEDEYAQAVLENQIEQLKLIRNLLELVDQHMDCAACDDPANESQYHIGESNDLWQIQYNASMTAVWGTRYQQAIIRYSKCDDTTCEIENGITPHESFDQMFDTYADRSGDIFGDKNGTRGQSYLINLTLQHLNQTHPDYAPAKKGHVFVWYLWDIIEKAINIWADMMKDAYEGTGGFF